LEEGDERQSVGSAFLVDMNKVFEDVVGNGIRAALGREGMTVDLQSEHRLDDDAIITIRPDIYVRKSTGSLPIAVADVKYKNPSEGLAIGDVYQSLAYATRFKLPECTLIYASRVDHASLQVGQTTVRLAHIDLSDAPEVRRARIDALADALIQWRVRALASD
jgi:5-methylcytosine-specific restriction endonuclease McrBC regulatory subunit McrC